LEKKLQGNNQTYTVEKSQSLVNTKSLSSLQGQNHRVTRVLALSAFDILLNKYYPAG
jgi:hypothetical protein